MPIDIPGVSDVIEALDKLFGKMHSKLDEIRPMVPVAIPIPYNGTTDSNGNLEINIGRAPVGKAFAIGRIVVIADSYTPSSPFTGSTSSWFGIFSGRGQNLGTLRDFQPYPPSLLYLPAVSEYSGHNVLYFNGGEEIYFGMTAGPVSKNITVIVTAWMTDQAGKVMVD